MHLQVNCIASRRDCRRPIGCATQAHLSDGHFEVVVHVADNRKQEALEANFEGLGPKACAGLERIAMDMWVSDGARSWA